MLILIIQGALGVQNLVKPTCTIPNRKHLKKDTEYTSGGKDELLGWKEAMEKMWQEK